MIHGTQTSESLSTARARQMAQSEVVETIEIGVKTIDLECVKVHPAGLSEARRPRDPNQVPRGQKHFTVYTETVLPKN